MAFDKEMPHKTWGKIQFLCLPCFIFVTVFHTGSLQCVFKTAESYEHIYDTLEGFCFKKNFALH